MSTQEETELDSSMKNNENINVKISRKPKCQIKFEISVTPQAVAAAHAKAIKNVNKEVSIPGFRKGKAPERLIVERYGSLIQKEWVDLVLNIAFQEAIQLTHIHPLKEGHVKRPVVHECSLEKGAKFDIEFETRPQVPTVDLAQLKIKMIDIPPVTDEQRENTLEQVRSQYITYEPIKDRAVEEGDFVDLDVDLLTEKPQQVVNNQRVRVDEKNLPDWLFPKVVGLTSGESAEGETTLSGVSEGSQPIPFRATVKGIWEGKIPSVDDELAKKVGLGSVEDLKQKIDERLEQENQIETEQQQMKELEEALLNSYPIELPQSMIDSDKQARLNHYLNQLKETHNEEYFRTNHARIEEMITKNTLRSLQLFLLLRKVAAENHLDVSNEDMSQELNRQLALVPSGRNQIDIYDKENLHSQVYNLALERKIKQFLLDKAVPVEG